MVKAGTGFHNVRSQEKGSAQSQSNGSNEAPKRTASTLSALRGEQETSPNVVTAMLKVFSIYVYDLLIRVLNFHLLYLL